MKRLLFVLAAAALAAPAAVHAQSITVTPSAGLYIPASDFYHLRDDAQRATIEKEGTLGLGLNVEFGSLRGSIAYATGSQINDRDGVVNQENIGEGTVLAIAGDFVFRPIPRIVVVQPYLLLGAGLRREDYSYEDDGIRDAFPEGQSDFAFHAGIGADVMFGKIGIVAEITDFITQEPTGEWSQHDAFGFVGLKFRVF
jgi:opacity protein-like surface antigen